MSGFNPLLGIPTLRFAIIIACIGYHVPAVRRRDRFYAKLEDERVERASA